MIIPHTDILFGLFILFRWDVDYGVITVSKTPGDKRSIVLIRLDLFPASLLGHRCRGKDDAFDIVLCQLVIERETEASCLIAAYEHDIVTVVETHGLDVIDDLAVMTVNFLRILGLFFLICITAERKCFLVNIHSDVNCAIMHFVISICMQ